MMYVKIRGVHFFFFFLGPQKISKKKNFSIFLQKELVNFFTKSNVLKKNALCLSKTLLLNEKQTEGADFACFCSLFSH